MKGFSVHLNSVYADIDESERCLAAARDGFRCVEIWAPPVGELAGAFVEQVQQLNLSVASVNTPEGPQPGDFGVAGDPSRVDWWRENFLTTLDFARRVHAEAINVLVGGRRAHVDLSNQMRCLTDNLEWALSGLGEGDPILLLEPLNGADRRAPLLRNVDDVLNVMDQLGRPPRLLILFDAYHLFQEEDDMVGALKRAYSSIGHVQLADYPGRAEPGTGDLPVARFLRHLAMTGYAGWVGLEYFPTGRGPAFAWLSDYAEHDDRVLPGVAS
jgi:hydroxypyruvate isomerase